ncbi:MAG: IPT/TIG domain-containing protein, partial [Actinomycetota bacterium]|nr:IPT/TIG domain-containing protein [Actinomycetota bacterium]
MSHYGPVMPFPRMARLAMSRGALGPVLMMALGASALVAFAPSGSSATATPTWTAVPSLKTGVLSGDPCAGGRPAPAAPRPTPRSKASMTAGLTSQAVLFGGRGCRAEPLADTWIWSASTWSSGPAGGGPPGRYDAAMAFDGRNVVMFGGDDGSSSSMGDTWLWDGSRWTSWSQKNPQAQPGRNEPGPRQQASMAYDEKQHKVLLFGGSVGRPGSLSDPFRYLNDTWSWDGQTWSEVQNASANGPSGRVDMATVYDRGRQEMLLFGGFADVVLGDTWSWDWVSRSWKPRGDPPAVMPPALARREAAMGFDASTGTVMLFGGTSQSSGEDCRSSVGGFCSYGAALDDTWTWDGVRWRLAEEPVDGPSEGPPDARSSAAVATDPVTGTVVLFGGHGSQYFDDTWWWGRIPMAPPGSTTTTPSTASALTTTTSTSTPPLTRPLVLGPVVRRLVPPSGPTSGGAPVSIQGQGFTGAVTVSFGDLRLDCAQPGACEVPDDSHLLVRSPAHDRGTVDVRVTTADGTSPVTRDPSIGDDQFTFVPPSPEGAADPFGPNAGGYGPGQPAQPAPPGGFGSAPAPGTGFGSAGANPAASPGVEV